MSERAGERMSLTCAGQVTAEAHPVGARAPLGMEWADMLPMAAVGPIVSPCPSWGKRGLS